MNVDALLDTLNRHEVDYLLIGGMNFLLRHQPVLTFDVDVWIEDTPSNRSRCQRALLELKASWGATEETWGPVDRVPGDWLAQRGVYCLITEAGPLDVFRTVTGLPGWSECANRAVASHTPAGISYRGLSDQDMLSCQLALAEPARKLDRIRALQDSIRAGHPHED